MRTTGSDGTELSYDVHPGPDGGDTLLLVHGITESSATWDPLVGPLTCTHRVVTMDLRGHGQSGDAPTYDLGSMAADVGAVMAATDDGRLPVLVGHSLGGAVVSAYAAGGPCRGVINVDQPLQLSGFQAVLQQLEPMLRGDEASFQAAIAAIFDQMAGALAGQERARVDALRQARQPVVLGIWELVLTAPAADLDAVVDAVAAQLSVPYLSLHGIDPGPDYAIWLTSRVPHATVEVWADQGHYPHLTQLDRFVARVREFSDGC